MTYNILNERNFYEFLVIYSTISWGYGEMRWIAMSLGVFLVDKNIRSKAFGITRGRWSWQIMAPVSWSRGSWWSWFFSGKAWNMLKHVETQKGSPEKKMWCITWCIISKYFWTSPEMTWNDFLKERCSSEAAWTCGGQGSMAGRLCTNHLSLWQKDEVTFHDPLGCQKNNLKKKSCRKIVARFPISVCSVIGRKTWLQLSHLMILPWPSIDLWYARPRHESESAE